MQVVHLILILSSETETVAMTTAIYTMPSEIVSTMTIFCSRASWNQIEKYTEDGI